MRFEPAGMTDDPDVRMAQSIVDYIFRRLALDFLPFETRSALGIHSVEERQRHLDTGSYEPSEDVDVEGLAQSAPRQTEAPAPAAPAVEIEAPAPKKQAHTNAELVEMLELEKSLVYINTSLRGNQRVLERLVRTSAVKKYAEDDDLLDDTVIENEQAIEMAGIYSGILSSTAETYATVIANNQNSIMKTLALATIVMAIPTMVFSAYGMNVDGIVYAHHPWSFAVVVGVTFVIAAIVIGYFIRKRWF
jgi:Mg2+ and Co2+ transporter CorA